MGQEEKDNDTFDVSYDPDSTNGFYEDILTYPEEKQHNKWSVSWSDLMMTMFILFAVMYIYQVGNKEVSFGFGPAKNGLSENGSGEVVNVNPGSRPTDVFDKTKQAIRDVMITDEVTVDLVKDNAVKIVLAGDLLFDSGRADLKLGSRYQLKQIARVLSQNDYFINVGGHTDDSPSTSDSFPTNWELSSERAVMVARYLIEACNIDEKRIYVTAHSYFQPVRPNDTAYNRALNRRVELILTKQKL